MSLRGYEYKKDYWETKDHKIIKIKDMETSHIENSINFLKQRPDFYDEEYYCWGVDNDDMYYDYIKKSYLVDEKIEELELELRFRKLEEK